MTALLSGANIIHRNAALPSVPRASKVDYSSTNLEYYKCEDIICKSEGPEMKM